jgi:hypothetical protein
MIYYYYFTALHKRVTGKKCGQEVWVRLVNDLIDFFPLVYVLVLSEGSSYITRSQLFAYNTSPVVSQEVKFAFLFGGYWEGV